MPRHHHVNLGVPPGGLAAQQAFLVDVLGYRVLEIPERVRAIAPRASWFEGDDGSQIHLSEDPEHRAPAAAHVAVELGVEEFAEVQERLRAAGVAWTASAERPGFPRVLLLRDPSGNRWELRSPA